MRKYFNIALISQLVVPSIAVCSFQIAISHAQDEPVASITQEIVVPLDDARGIGEDAVQAGASALSNDSQVIVYFGDNYEAYKSIVSAAQDIIAEDKIPLKGIILADPLEPEFVNGYQISTDQEIEIYADGQKTSTIMNPHAGVGNLKNDIKDRLQKDYDRIIVPRRAETAKKEDQISPDDKKVPKPEN